MDDVSVSFRFKVGGCGWGTSSDGRCDGVSREIRFEGGDGRFGDLVGTGGGDPVATGGGGGLDPDPDA